MGFAPMASAATAGRGFRPQMVYGSRTVRAASWMHLRRRGTPATSTTQPLRSLATSTQKRISRGQRVVPGGEAATETAPKYLFDPVSSTAGQSNKVFGSSMDGKKDGAVFGMNPAMFWLGLFPLFATGALVAVREDLREQVLENHRQTPWFGKRESQDEKNNGPSQGTEDSTKAGKAP